MSLVLLCSNTAGHYVRRLSIISELVIHFRKKNYQPPRGDLCGDFLSGWH
jgi:hypothetical protein